MSEDKQVVVTAGPYKDQRLTMPAADADQAIADGWAIDPYAPVDPDAKPKEQTDEDRAKTLEAADKALRKLRGEEESEKPATPQTRQMEPEHIGKYPTRDHPSRR